MRDYLRRVAASYPVVRQPVDSILRLREEVNKLPTAPFFEPVSLVEVLDGKRRLAVTSAALINAWCQHVAYGSRVRLWSIEEGIVSELGAGRLLGSMVLARAHMESAAQAAYCEELLVDAANAGAWDRLDDIVLRTMLGTSLRIAAKRAPQVEEFISPGEHFPLEMIGETIKALDRFAAGQTPGHHSQVLYSFLCEFAHPTLRGSKGFFEATDRGCEGWTIRYDSDGRELFDEKNIGMVLEILLENMRLGYACSELLRRSRVFGNPPAFQLVPPSPEDGRYIWSQLLQRVDPDRGGH